MFLNCVIIYCCALFDLTGNTVDEPVQRQHFILTLICIENALKLVLFGRFILCFIVTAGNLI